MTKTALVTGSSGFLGMNVCEELCEQGWQVYALRRASSRTRDLDRLPVTQLIGDVLDPEGLDQVVPEGLDALFHVAADVSMWKQHNTRQNRINIEGTQNIIDLVQKKNVKRLVYTSSIGYWGIAEGMINEETATDVLSCGVNYYVSKYHGEELVQKAVKDGLIEAVILNPAQVIGPYDYTHLPDMMREAASGRLLATPSGNSVCGHARDYAKAHIAAAERGRVGERYILGGHKSTFHNTFSLMSKMAGCKPPRWVAPDFVFSSLGVVMETMAKITKKEPMITPEMVTVMLQQFDLDSSKAERELGFTTCSLEEMLQDAYDWAQQEALL